MYSGNTVGHSVRNDRAGMGTDCGHPPGARVWRHTQTGRLRGSPDAGLSTLTGSTSGTPEVDEAAHLKGEEVRLPA